MLKNHSQGKLARQAIRARILAGKLARIGTLFGRAANQYELPLYNDDTKRAAVASEIALTEALHQLDLVQREFEGFCLRCRTMDLP